MHNITLPFFLSQPSPTGTGTAGTGTGTGGKMGGDRSWKVELFPWDPTCEAHVDRLYHQRVSCGWRADEVHSWAEIAKRGEKIFFWITLSNLVPGRDKLLKKHTQAYPKESIQLKDTAATVRSTARKPTLKDFSPIGHVALEVQPAHENVRLGFPSEGVVWVHSLYVSWPLQTGGFGAAAMDAVETIASQHPLNATTIALDSVSKTQAWSPSEKREIYKALYVDRGIPIPLVSRQDWYDRRGYEVVNRETAAYACQIGDFTFPFDVVFMKKTLEARDDCYPTSSL